nr:MAG TPA: hypothetical protein [Caudoviricetes sp.]DAZ78307.1 MAG TPA: hypothetical protein [Caudoviricetes sp.]
MYQIGLFCTLRNLDIYSILILGKSKCKLFSVKSYGGCHWANAFRRVFLFSRRFCLRSPNTFPFLSSFLFLPG